MNLTSVYPCGKLHENKVPRATISDGSGLLTLLDFREVSTPIPEVISDRPKERTSKRLLMF